MKQALRWIAAVLLLLLFVGLTYAVTHVNVEYIGPQSTCVGLADLNTQALDLLKARQNGEILYNEKLYKLSELLGLVSLAVVGVFAVTGLAQLIRRKSLLKVDGTIWCLAGLYIVTGALYVLFTKLIINYRPIILPGEGALEAGFPSSHTMLAVTVLGSAVIVIKQYIKFPALRVILRLLSLLLLLAAVASRLLSGAHWPTDILAGVLLGGSLVAFFAAVRGGDPEEA